MRSIMMLVILAGLIAMCVKWRYKLAKLVVGIRFLYRLVESVMDHIPSIKEQLSIGKKSKTNE